MQTRLNYLSGRSNNQGFQLWLSTLVAKKHVYSLVTRYGVIYIENLNMFFATLTVEMPKRYIDLDSDGKLGCEHVFAEELQMNTV